MNLVKITKQLAFGRRVAILALLMILLLALTACGGDKATPTPTLMPRTPVPTFTPTPVGQAPAAEVPLAQAPAAEVAPAPAVVEVAPADTPLPAEPTATPVPQVAKLTVTGDNINVRRGPDTSFGVVGQVSQGMSFDVLGRNAAGDWYQFCCVNGEQGWIFGTLVTVDNPGLVAVALDIPAPPPVPTSPPAAPTNTPAPAAPPAAADPCANIGGDGCKFRVTGGPTSANNDGLELKLQFFFIHSGVDGGQPQGSYRVNLVKDGQTLNIDPTYKSISLNANQGTLGRYNYEFKLGLGNLPGGTVAGNYTGWVLDGNGERDSQNFSFTLGGGQGEVWIQFDQG
ncbi:MAG: SH3 domain-containing protein [Caldilineaceae bacterium]|nr:SH3 domain-containing protein [Caldilineaceae bacterium]MBP8107566.1 SH3 domain-containing protein [Caldilineaceae bacterium]MBP8124872.1 SH3 domain-containing protein [Caldilineaceae bacterium]MBP9074603.1 SH3 domain-containing protein [Caldilineaceae bacterium]